MPPPIVPGTISEKTVELNFTLELVNYLSVRSGRSCFAWGPTLRQEANWGFDAAIGLSGRFIYIQYKKATVEGPGYVYPLNRTTARDQHSRLLQLESMGVSSWYLLPKFTTLNEIAAGRRRLLTRPNSTWIKPSQIPVPNGGTGHHDLHIHPTRTWLTSDPIEMSEPEDWNAFDVVNGGTPLENGNSQRWEEMFQKVFRDAPDAADGGALMFAAN